jgi:microcystin-dependent protein
MAISIPYSFTDGQTIVAAQHNSNFNAIASFVDALQAGTNFNAGAIGTTSINDLAVTGGKIAGGAVTLDKLAAAVANALVPTGTVVPFSGSSVPNADWLLADGTAVSRTTYAALFAVVGTTYNTGGEAGTDFRLPNLKGRVAVGRDSSQTEFDTLSETGGAKTVALTQAQLAAHTHPNTITSVSVAGNVGVSLGGGDHSHTATTGTTGSSHAHPLPSVRQGAASSTHNGSTTIAAGFSSPTEVYLDTGSTGSTHTHNVTVDSANAGVTVTGTSFTQTSGSAVISNQPIGSGEAHNNLQPYIVLNYIIKA